MLLRRSLVFCVVIAVAAVKCSLPNGQAYWNSLAQRELKEALSVQRNTNRAKNVILFIGDGMGPNTVTATRIHMGGEGHRLSFEEFPNVGLLKTYSANKMVPDSACTATALLCGVKTNGETIGVDDSVAAGDCEASLRPEARLTSLAAESLAAGKSAGLVTTMRVSHATPAAVYAQAASRQWECDARVPPSAARCKDIARQLVEDWPGRDLQVILGGGKASLDANSSSADPYLCQRGDGRDLISTYVRDKQSRGLKHAYVTNTRQLQDIDFENTDYLLGIFADSHMHYEFERDQGPEGMPSLADMTEAAIKVLQKNPNGFFLMVEGGNIDMAHHRGSARAAVAETAALAAAVRRAGSLAADDTLLLVTADHTHTLSINGYQPRGADVFGIAAASPVDQVNYTTLSYATGGPGSMHYYADEAGRVRRKDPSEEDTRDYYYEQVAGIQLDENSHGGGDVTIYAKGPFAHLFHSIHEQHYVYHAVCYASQLGEYLHSNGISINQRSCLAMILVCYSILSRYFFMCSYMYVVYK